MPARGVRTEKLDLRLSSSDKRIREAAASASRRSESDFARESALASAEETLADRRMFHLSKVKWTEFLAALDAPTRPLARMQRLLTKPGFFDATSAPGSKEKR